MSISSAISAAKAGLRVDSARTDLIARNISNANTPGYSRKAADVSTGPQATPSVVSIDRQVDSMLDRLDRANLSKLSRQQTVADGMRAYTDHLGQPEGETSPAASMARLKGAFVALQTGVSDLSAQIATVSAARELAGDIRSLSGTLDVVGNEVEMNIRYEVADLNEALYDLSRLNGKINSEPAGTDARSELDDQMDRLIDKISGIMDVQVVTGRSGMVSVLTGGGVELVRDRDVSDVVYNPATGALTAGDTDMTPGTGSRSFTEGSLAGLYKLKRDEIPAWQGQLDTMAAALVEGFGRVAPVDGGPGLFTDAGAGYDPANIAGLAGRITVNAAMDPDLGGDPGLLQSGGADDRPVGDPTLIDAMIRLFDQPTQIAGREFGDSPGLVKMAAGIVAAQQKDRAIAENAVSTTMSTANTIQAARENFRGVDVDDELQKLLVVEQSYAANAKVLATLSTMMDTLLNSA